MIPGARWKEGVAIKLGVDVPPGWELLSVDTPSQVTARLDSGEVVSLQTQGGNSFGIFDRDAQNRNPLEGDIEGSENRDLERRLTLHLNNPMKPSSRVVSLTGTCKVMVVNRIELKHVDITPKVGPAQAVPGSDITISLSADGKLSLKCGPSANGQGPANLDHVSYLGADGKPLGRRGTSSRGGNDGTTIEITFDRPINRVALDFYDKVRAAEVDFILTEIPLIGHADTATLGLHQVKAMRELPAPDFSAPPVKPPGNNQANGQANGQAPANGQAKEKKIDNF